MPPSARSREIARQAVEGRLEPEDQAGDGHEQRTRAVDGDRDGEAARSEAGGADRRQRDADERPAGEDDGEDQQRSRDLAGGRAAGREPERHGARGDSGGDVCGPFGLCPPPRDAGGEGEGDQTETERFVQPGPFDIAENAGGDDTGGDAHDEEERRRALRPPGGDVEHGDRDGGHERRGVAGGEAPRGEHTSDDGDGAGGEVGPRRVADRSTEPQFERHCHQPGGEGRTEDRVSDVAGRPGDGHQHGTPRRRHQDRERTRSDGRKPSAGNEEGDRRGAEQRSAERDGRGDRERAGAGSGQVPLIGRAALTHGRHAQTCRGERDRQRRRGARQRAGDDHDPRRDEGDRGERRSQRVSGRRGEPPPRVRAGRGGDGLEADEGEPGQARPHRSVDVAGRKSGDDADEEGGERGGGER